MIPSTLRISLVLIVIIYFALVLLLLKKRAISLKYTLLWLLAGFVMGIMVIWPQTLVMSIRIIGIEDNMNGLFVISIGFLIAIAMALTSIVSRQTEKIRSLVQTIAMLEKRVRELEKKYGVEEKTDTD